MRPRVLLAFLMVGILSGGIARRLAAGENQFHVRTHRATYWHPGLSPRARGLGHSYAALSNGASGVYENPASLGAQTDREVLFDLGIDELDEGANEATWVTIHAGGAFNINACAPHYWPRENVGNHTAGFVIRHNGVEFSERDALTTDLDGIVLAYGRSFRGGRAFGGMALAYDEGDQADDDATIDTDILRWEFRLGGIYRATKTLALGGVLALARGELDGTGTRLDQDGELSHVEIRGGAAYQLTPATLLVGDVVHAVFETDLERDMYEEHSIWTLSAGMEHVVVPDTLLARGGIYYTRDSYNARNAPSGSLVDDWAGISGGISYFKDMFTLGYTLDLRTTGNVGHFFRVEYDW